MTHKISHKQLSFKILNELATNPVTLELSVEAVLAIKNCRKYLDDNFGDEVAAPTYGVNTGFGSLCNTYIDKEKLELLQRNLLMSHACGTGDLVPEEIIKWMLFLKIQSLSYGHSGVQLATVERLIYFFNNDILPVVYEQGSLGASGDLAPLAHLALPLIGLGEVYYNGERRSTQVVLDELNLEPIKLQSKEGLALINGTQFMLAYGVKLMLQAHQLWYQSTVIAAMSIDSYDCNLSPYDARIHLIRPHAGQVKTAALINTILSDSEIAASSKNNVQDPYSFRCVPQVHGATWDTLQFVSKTILTEVNSVTDNPNIFIDSGAILSGGNFHGQPLALALDYLAIAMSELGNISERRTYQLMSGSRGLPAFLIANPGLNSGMMILQYTAASIVSQNKQLSTPASVDSIVSSNGQEDHVSMGANAATKCYKIITNLYSILGIELLASTQALDHREMKSSPFIRSITSLVRQDVPYLDEDRVLYNDIERARNILKTLNVDVEELTAH